MVNELQLLGDIIIEKKREIAQLIHEKRMSGVMLTEQQKKELQRLEPTIMDMRIQFIELLGAGITEQSGSQKIFPEIEEWGKETGAYFYDLGAPLDEALKETRYYRTYIWKAMEKEAIARNLSAASIFKLISVFDPLLDHAVYYFSLEYVRMHQKTLENARNAFLELSVPVVPLLKGVGVLPLIGNIDTERSRLLMEKTLQQATNLKLTHLIFDVSGVQIVDTMVADQLFKVIDALSLLGVETIITGIRPEVAQTMITLGLSVENLNVKANLHQAFEDIRLLKDK
ncbi:STAS domain-containing protein [Domibacillus indicus]|uniref:STAS domain-containing protein n=1 Tax=Domibacillus indicus TaxID=1437523 RepID=UPI000617B9D2|nr:STAS domain-containing protein [Domibacillus indicus]